jgi:ribosome modulation factor
VYKIPNDFVKRESEILESIWRNKMSEKDKKKSVSLSKPYEKLAKNQKYISGIEGLTKTIEDYGKNREYINGIIGLSKSVEAFSKNQKYISGIEGLTKSFEDNGKNREYINGITGLSKSVEAFSKNQKYISGIEGLTKTFEDYGKNQQYLNGITGLSKSVEAFNKNQKYISEIERLTKTFDKFSVNSFNNLVVSKEIIEKSFPNIDVRNFDVRNMFSGLSPSNYTLKNDVLENKFNASLVKNDTSDEIPFKSAVSSVSSIDLIKNITKEEVLSFYIHLSRFPMLGSEHEVGRKIIDDLDQINVLTLCNKTLYRARPRDTKKRAIPYTPDEMFSAPYGLSGQGRYNVVGQGELYTCDNKDVAVKECTKGITTTVDVIEFELIEKIELIDLTDKVSPLVQYCSFSLDTSTGLEYLVPNFIAQCAKSKGIDGITFISNQDEKVLNYVFFDYKKGWFEVKKLEEVRSA